MKKQYALMTAGLMFASFLTACDQKDPAKKVDNEVACMGGSFYDANFSPIVGGQLVAENTWVARKTVFLLSTSGETSSCTATLIDRDVVLTAAHCVEGALKEPETLIVVFSARPQCDVENETIISKAIPAAAIRMHKDYDPEGSAIGGGDMALIKLSKEAPATVETVELKVSETAWTSYDRILIAGYGRTIGGASEVEDPRPVSLRAIVRKPLVGDAMKTVREGLRKNAMNEMPETFANMWLDLIFDSSAQSEMIWLDQTDKRGACSGDSGGPAFVIEDGKIKQLGVATSVLTGASPEETCLIASNYTNVLKYKDWISENYQALTGRDASRIFPK